MLNAEPSTIQIAFVLLPVAFASYVYLLYPAMLWLVGARRSRTSGPVTGDALPAVAIVVIAYNEARSIGATLDALVSVDYPRERIVQILVVSDGSTDGTDDIVKGYARHGVELIRTPRRMGKTAAENCTLGCLRGDIVVNTDAAVRVHPGAVRALVDALADPAVGLASGLDVSVPSAVDESNGGESIYVDYEMRVRDVETRTGGIVGGSGCLFAIRRELHLAPVPTYCLRDFAAPLMVKAAGFRSVSVPGAVCWVPRSASLRAEYRRKVRTFALGMGTVWWQRRHLNPATDPVFAWKLMSHKVARWLLPWTAVPAVALLALTARGTELLVLAALALACAGSVALGLWWPVQRPQPRLLAFVNIGIASSVASIHATFRALRRTPNHTWEPTRRNPSWIARREAVVADAEAGAR